MGGVLDHVQDPVPVLGELLDLVEGVLAYHVDEELHIRTRDECLPGSLEYDCVDVRPPIEVLHHSAQLAYHCDIQRVHRLWPVDQDRGDASFVHIDVDVAELEGIGPPGEPFGHLQSRHVCVSHGHPGCLRDSDPVGELEWAHCPSQPDLGSPVDVLHAADSFLDYLGADREGLTHQPLLDYPGCFLVAFPVLVDLPHLSLLHEGAHVVGTSEAGYGELLGQVVAAV